LTLPSGWAVAASLSRLDTEASGGLLEDLGVGMGLGVVGKDPLDPHPWSAKKLAASTRNRAAAMVVSWGRSWLSATRERSSTAEGTSS
jgi:hypothetical protein